MTNFSQQSELWSPIFKRILSGYFLFFVALAGFAGLVGLSHSNELSIEAEIQNLNALSGHYWASCSEGNLIIKSSTSAVFRIKDSALCIGKPENSIVCGSPIHPKNSSRGLVVSISCADLRVPKT